MTAPLAMHIHVEVQIYLDGQPLAIPADVGVFGQAAYPLHTHDSSGLVHIESPVARDFHLQDFFAVWNTTPEGHAVLAMLDAARYLTVTDDGAISTGLPLVPLHDHDSSIIQALSASPSAAAAANETLVTKLDNDLLQRAPDTPGLVSLSTALDQGLSRTQLVQSILASAEYHSLEVQNLYHALLHRDPDPAGQASFLAFLAMGGTIQQVEGLLLASPEYFGDQGGTNAAFVAALYHDVLGRQAEAAGFAAWQLELTAGQSRVQITIAFLHSQEAETLAIDAIYQEYLHRPSDDAGRQSFLIMLGHGITQEQVTAQVLGSPEYLGGV